MNPQKAIEVLQKMWNVLCQETRWNTFEDLKESGQIEKFLQAMGMAVKALQQLDKADFIDSADCIRCPLFKINNPTLIGLLKSHSDYYSDNVEHNKWIPVSERLPEVVLDEFDIQCSEDVLVYDGADLRVGYFVENNKHDFNYWVVYGDYCFRPIAWMPLPEPYKASPTGEDSTCDSCKTPCVMYEKGIRGCNPTGAEKEG